jgi:Ran GTPase-activating protein (RanGAP) involved in mRNA processing and transport
LEKYADKKVDVFVVVWVDWTKCGVVGNTIRELEVENVMSGGDWIGLVEVMRSSKTLERVSFLNGAMSIESVKLLSKVLQGSKVLEKLELRGTSQSVEGVKAIMESVSENCQSAAFVEAIEAVLEGVPPSATPCGLFLLDLSDNMIGDEGVSAMAPFLKKTHISTMILDNVGMTTEGFKRLFMEMPKGIQGTTIRSQKVITKIPFGLTRLCLNSNAPGLEGVKAIADFLSLNTTITDLSLRKCQLGDTSVGLLAKSLGSSSLSRLSHLDLSDNQIGINGSDSLISLLSNNHLIVHLNLSNNIAIPLEKQSLLSSLTVYNQRLVDSRHITPWRSEASISILNEDGTTVGVTCATVLSNGLVFIGSSYGDVYVWNPYDDESSSSDGNGSSSKSSNNKSSSISLPSKSSSSPPPSSSSSSSSSSSLSKLSHVRASIIASDPSFLKNGKIESKIITYEPESRPTKRRINALIDNQDGTIWCVSDERAITIVNIQERNVQKRLPLHKYQAISIAKYGMDIYLGGATGEVSLWRSDSLACRHEIVLDGRYPISAIHSDGIFIYVGVLVHPSRSGHVLVFSQAMELVQHFEAHSQFISSITTFQGKIITSSWDKLIKIWSFDQSSSSISLLHTLDGHHDKVTSLVISNGKAISCSDDNTLIVWNMTPNSSTPKETLKETSISSHSSTTSNDSSPSSSYDPSPNDTTTASSSSDQMITPSSTDGAPVIEKRMLGAWGGSIYSLFAAHDKLVSCSHKEGRVTLWSLN